MKYLDQAPISRDPLMQPKKIFAVILVSSFALAGCQTFYSRSKTTPFQYQLVREQLVLHSDFPFPEQHRLIDELLLVRDTLSDELELTLSDEPLHIYLFEEKESYYDFIQIHYPGFANRRAIFVETDITLSVYAHWGDRVAEDLRHETVHGYLHALIPNLPLWLDEGLAEYYEVARGRHGLNEEHLDYLDQHSKRLAKLSRLEQLTSAVDMTQKDYAESWAWVHFLLESTDDKPKILTEYLADLQRGMTQPTLHARLRKRFTTPELALAEHLQLLR
ncbi:MAG: hypothetical protein CMJ72_09810 [Planctomycetaceae bacterium]|nr:hypothetical protein [Planctomycetaceae bacterium]HCK42128.1 hypothetical protein [Planctomycetaceae bacterium]